MKNKRGGNNVIETSRQAPGRKAARYRRRAGRISAPAWLIALGWVGLAGLGGAGGVSAQSESSALQGAPPRQYTFAWMFSDAAAMKPRGGSTRGPRVALDTQVSGAFRALQAPGLSAKERDRRAILAMAGDYRTSFDFIETVGLTPAYTPRSPYQSWGTERVYLVADRPDLISLQHIIVMHFALDDGSISAPMVVKHWRQDWRYQDREVHAFVGRNRFERVTLKRSRARGAWTQTVYQVDDSPRYEAVGRWTHAPGLSSWESDDRRRPLPRREFSVRDDYHALYGSHRITITPSGWTQEEDALKLVLDEHNAPDPRQPYLAREAGLSRYERVRDYDFAAGDAYWAQTGAFWAEVRAYWERLYAGRDEFAFNKAVDSTPMFVALFKLAEEEFGDSAARSAAVRRTIERYLIE